MLHVPEMVKCDTCNEEYREAFPGGVNSGQGYQCASSVTNEYIIGHYGSSEIDGELWTWSTERPDYVKLGVICDSCLIELQLAHKIRLSEEGRWFD